jgi:hypothetical protein
MYFCTLKKPIITFNLEKENLIENQSLVGEDKPRKQKTKKTKWTH